MGTKTERPKWWEFLLGVVLLFSVMLLLNKGCSYLTGVEDARIVHQKVFNRLSLPENSTCEELLSIRGDDPTRAGLAQRCHSSLTIKELKSFYREHLYKLGWQLERHEYRYSPSSEDYEEHMNWLRGKHIFRVTIMKKKEKIEEYEYFLEVEWRVASMRL